MLMLCALALLAGAALAAGPAAEAAAAYVDLTGATVVVPPGASSRQHRAAAMLVDEVEKRTRVRWPIAGAWPTAPGPVVAVGLASGLASLGPVHGLSPAAAAGEEASLKPEGYRVRVAASHPAPVVVVAGADDRGVLFGVGRILRGLRMGRDRVAAPGDLDIVSSPRYALRGHQLGYRPKTNSYDGWSLPMWEQYIRDLAVFGANAVELIPPRSDDDADSPHFPLPPMPMMVGMSRLLDEYGLDVWIWYPAMDRDYGNAATVEAALREWDAVFRQLPRVDAVFVPGGDPGHTPPGVLMGFLEKQAASLRRRHPGARIWVSPQGFAQAWFDEFTRILRDRRPAWLGGIVFGPQVRVSLARLRAQVPQDIPIRRYPDITHSRECQYPVPDWDTAYAVTEGREGINPRPQDQARIFRAADEHAVGFITYSEGCNDDVNKAVWSALGWDPECDVAGVLRDYSRYFIGERYADPFAQGLLALEGNWRGPLLTNDGVVTTLQQFQEMERAAEPDVRLNWRFQQALYRAYYDAYVQSRLRYEMALEDRALEFLRRAPELGSLAAMREAETVLGRAVSHPVSQDWRARVFELAEALFQSIRMQLSVARYQAIAVGRGANLDTIDEPLNDRLWLLERFAALRAVPAEPDRLKGIAEIVAWTDPGPGGFYDEPGNPLRRPHLVGSGGFEADPGSYETPRTGFSGLSGRRAWARHAETLYDTPLVMRYTGLDPDAAYRIRVVYGGNDPERKVRLVADDGLEIHALLAKPVPARPLEFAVPRAAIRDGVLTLRWTGEPGRGGNGRGCQVSEVWLRRAEPGAPVNGGGPAGRAGY